MRTFRFLYLSGLIIGMVLTGSAEEAAPDFSPSESAQLAAGQCVILSRRPGESDPVDSRFVSGARLIAARRKTVWETVQDKDHASDFIEGILSSKVIERNGNTILVEQRTRVGGPKGSYLYRLLHILQEMERADFTFVSGEVRDIAGAWMFFDGSAPNTCILVYSLRIDPGLLAPQTIVKAGMRKSIPLTLESIANEAVRREAK